MLREELVRDITKVTDCKGQSVLHLVSRGDNHILLLDIFENAFKTFMSSSKLEGDEKYLESMKKFD